ncbi:hypothetical protein EBR21_08510, partial [bacterium]|nr:hypothetical protein [bacterium]
LKGGSLTRKKLINGRARSRRSNDQLNPELDCRGRTDVKPGLAIDSEKTEEVASVEFSENLLPAFELADTNQPIDSETNPLDSVSPEDAVNGDQVTLMMNDMFETLHKKAVEFHLGDSVHKSSEVMRWELYIEKSVTTKARRRIAEIANQISAEITRLTKAENNTKFIDILMPGLKRRDPKKYSANVAREIHLLQKQLMKMKKSVDDDYENVSRQIAKMRSSLGFVNVELSGKPAVVEVAHLRRYRLVSEFLSQKNMEIRDVILANGDAIRIVSSEADSVRKELEVLKARATLLRAKGKKKGVEFVRQNEAFPHPGLNEADRLFQRVTITARAEAERRNARKETLQSEFDELSNLFISLMHHRDALQVNEEQGVKNL